MYLFLLGILSTSYSPVKRVVEEVVATQVVINISPFRKCGDRQGVVHDLPKATGPVRRIGLVRQLRDVPCPTTALCGGIGRPVTGWVPVAL